MNTINLYINETLGDRQFHSLQQSLLSNAHVRDVHFNPNIPHDLLVEFDEHENMPMHVLDMIKAQGLHADIVGC